VTSICEAFSSRQAIACLEGGCVVILAAGTGNPFFTTDTCAALRAGELEADVLFKATKVDGVFQADPVTDPKARRYDRLTYQQVLADRLGVMDLTAISMCMERHIPIVVFQLSKPGNLLRAAMGEPVGTIVSD
jgi:uridylate kinase